MVFTVKSASGVEYGIECITKLEDLQLLQERFIDEWRRRKDNWGWKPTLIIDFEKESIIVYDDWIE